MQEIKNKQESIKSNKELVKIKLEEIAKLRASIVNDNIDLDELIAEKFKEANGESPEANGVKYTDIKVKNSKITARFYKKDGDISISRKSMKVGEDYKLILKECNITE